MTEKKKTDKKRPTPPAGAQLENKAMPAHRDDARMNTAAYPTGTAPSDEVERR